MRFFCCLLLSVVALAFATDVADASQCPGGVCPIAVAAVPVRVAKVTRHTVRFRSPVRFFRLPRL